MSVLGDRLRIVREKRGWTKVYVSQRLGMKRVSTYANWEYGLREPDTEMLNKLSTLYDVPVGYLTGRVDSPTLRVGSEEIKLPSNLTEEFIKKVIEKHDVKIESGEDQDRFEKLVELFYGHYNRDK